jgi:hypothetical protein
MTECTLTKQVRTVFQALQLNDTWLKNDQETEDLLRKQAKQVGYRTINQETAYFFGLFHTLKKDRDFRRAEALALIGARLVYNERYTHHIPIEMDQIPGMTMEDSLAIGLAAGSLMGRLESPQ